MKKPQLKTKRLVVLAEPDLVELVRARALRDGLSIGEIVRAALWLFLETKRP